MTTMKKVGIIGAGASGLTAIKCAVEEGKSILPKSLSENPFILNFCILESACVHFHTELTIFSQMVERHIVIFMYSNSFDFIMRYC